MRDKYKALAERGLKMLNSPFIPGDIRALVGELVALLGEMVEKIDQLDRKAGKDGGV
mgnify:CR=1 FL=1